MYSVVAPNEWACLFCHPAEVVVSHHPPCYWSRWVPSLSKCSLSAETVVCGSSAGTAG